MSDLASSPEVGTIKNRSAALRIQLDGYIKRVTRVYKRPEPIGFDFDCDDTHGLILALTLNLSFGVDNKTEIPGYLATKLATGLSFREVNTTNSLHFEISKLTVNVHLDTVSVALGRDEHGDIIYDSGNLLQHLVRDHWNKPNIIAPNSNDGFVVGYRF